MSNVDFQNGFICGMATKGLVRSGDYYQPNIYNDSGVFNYFYIDFRRTLMPFSLGMFNDSIVVHDDEQVNVTNVEYVSPGVYKVYCDLANKIHGITVLNKATSRLRFGSSSEKVSPFSIHAFISGLASYDSSTYLYDKTTFPACCGDVTESTSTALCDAINAGDISETATFTFVLGTVSETVNVALT